MGFLSSIADALGGVGSFLSKPLGSFVKTIAGPAGQALGGYLGGPMGAQLGGMLGGGVSDLMKDSDAPNAGGGARGLFGQFGNMPIGTVPQFAGQHLQGMVNRYLPDQIQESTFGNVGQNIGQMGGQRFGNFLQNMVPQQYRQGAIGQGLNQFGNWAGNQAGTGLQNAIDMNTPRRWQDQQIGTIGGNLGRQFQDAVMPSLPRSIRKAPLNNAMQAVANEAGNQATQYAQDKLAPYNEPEQIGLAGMGYATGGPVRYYPGANPNWMQLGQPVSHGGHIGYAGGGRMLRDIMDALTMQQHMGAY